jgi:hypothetical protein
MKYYYINENNEKVLSSNNFDNLVQFRDSEMSGFVVEAKDWDAAQAALNATKQYMTRDGVALVGSNLELIKSVYIQALTTPEFTYLMRNTFLNGEYGNDMDVYYSERNMQILARIATPAQREILGAYRENGYK